MKRLYKICYPILAVSILAGCSSGIANPSANGSYISEEAAKEKAYNHANVTAKDVASLQLKNDTEDGKDIYSIEFYTKDKKYEYDIDRHTGEILNNESEKVATTIDKEKASETAKNNTSTTTKTTTKNSSSSINTNNSTTSTSITKEKAKSIALNHAKVSENSISGLKIENDWEDGQAVYSISFHAGNYEYEYDITKNNGSILNVEKDYEKQNTSSTNMISKDKAISIALAKVKGATTKNIHIELERDDGKYTYEGEIYYNNKEYEFEIDAYTGNILKWEVDSID